MTFVNGSIGASCSSEQDYMVPDGTNPTSIMPMFRKPTKKDLPKIKELCDAQGIEVPNFRNCLEYYIIEQEGKIIGFCAIELFAECIIALDPKASKRKRSVALVVADKISQLVAGENSCKRLHIVVKDKMAKIMKKHFGYTPVDGLLMEKDLG